MRDRIYDALTRHPRYLGGLAVLVVVLLVTQGLQAWQVHRVAADVQGRQVQVARTAQATIQQDFERLVAELEQLARRTARRTDVVEGMQAHRGEGRSEPLVRHAARRHLPENFAVEFYDREERLLAWNGFSMPLDDALHAPDTLDAGFTTVAQDDGVRWALVAWQPVRHDGEVVGAVRAMRLVHFRMPVQNQYIQDYSLERRWRIQTGYPVTVIWGAVDAVSDLEDREGVLRAGDHVLGRVVVQPPGEEQLLQSVQQRYADLSALWQTLLLFWLVAGLWMWYRRVDRTDAASDSARAQAAVRFLVVAVAWWGLRYMLIEMDVPGRWQTGKAPLAPLFDPTHLASPIGGGIMESIGDLLVTACFALLFTVGFIDLAARFRVDSRSLSTFWTQIRDIPPTRPSAWRFLGVVVIAVLVELGQVLGLARLARRAVLDSTLDFFARTGLLPEPLVLAVLCSLLLITVAAVLCGAGMLWVALYALGRYRPRGWSVHQLVSAVALTAGGVFIAAFVATDNLQSISVPIAIAHGGVVIGVALVGIVQGGGVVKHFTLRSLLPGLIVLTVLLYPMLYDGMDQQRRGRMVDATTSFVEGSDPRVVFSLEQVLRRARESATVQRAFNADRGLQLAAPLDSVATELLRTSLVASLSQYEASLLLVDAAGTPQESYSTTGSEAQRGGEQYEPSVFNALRVQAAMRGDGGPVVERLTDRRQQSRFRYAGLVAIADTSGGTVGWVMARAEPRSLLPGTGTPYPRVLLPEGLYGDLYADLALAEFREGTIVRSIGDFGRARLTHEARDALQERAALWRTESVNGRRYLAYYRQEYGAPHAVVAARMPAIMVFDHLYYLLRLVIAGFGIGVPFYLLGLYLRYRRGVLPAPRVRFRDKMLDAFLVVGSIAVIVVGFVGARTIVSENERTVHNQLQQDIDRVEEALLLDTQRDEMLYRAAERVRIDSLANRVGLDLNLYEDGHLVASSRPRLVREQLIDARMPVAAYEALHHDAYHFTTTTEQFGAFTYTVGYQALPDEAGQPRYVLAVPTLPEQERIQEERARTLAYLLGALLLLIVVIMVTALFLANALAQPIARLREGLEAVGEGRYAKRLPIDTRDEIGELVQTFNAMREQLAESRRRLAQQERELAWREMARQVAHEIKNPLTPMKLAVQHLRRAFQQVDGLETERASDEGGRQRFAELFDRITSTLVEQINTLARIANEFSTFARLPERVLEPLDLNEVIREAVALMREEEEDVAIELDLHPEPLVVKADREELRRLYINLIKNAMQAIPAAREGAITVATAPDGAAQQVKSWVQDNGVGIPPAQRDKIFQPNFSTKTSGTGLGLAIARKTIGELSGDIGFYTEEGAGTTFWVRLPRAA